MGVTITKKGSAVTEPLIASNKPFPEAYVFNDGNGTPVMVSRPMVDHICLLGHLPDGLLAGGSQGKNPAKRYKRTIKEAINAGEGGLRQPNKGKPFAKGFPKKDEVRTWIKVGDRGARVEIHLKPIHAADKKTLISYRLRVSWNPRKAGSQGAAQIRDCLREHFLLLNEVDTWFQNAEVTRLDIAVDILGAERCDITTWLPDQTKVQTYGRSAPGIETVNHYTGHTISSRAPLMVYDKRQEQADLGKTPKFGGTAHTRVERMLGFKKLKPKLASLAEQPNRLAGFKVRLLRDSVSFSRDDQRLAVAANTYLGTERTKAILGGQHAKVAAFVRADDSEFWQPDILWKHWPLALIETGLMT